VWTNAPPEAIARGLCASILSSVLKSPFDTKDTKDLTKNTKPGKVLRPHDLSVSRGIGLSITTASATIVILYRENLGCKTSS
jgi:hypothetical protein